ncbi:MAG: hypothetical protein ACRD8O_22460 [Bryobacteraceae bacterium]
MTGGFRKNETKTAVEGSFAFHGVRAGEWRVLAALTRSQTDLRGFATALVSRWDVDRVEIRLTPPFAVEGFVDREEPRDRQGKRPASAVYLIPADGQPEQRGKFHEQDGTIRFDNVYPGRYWIRPAGFVRGYYVAPVLSGGAFEIDSMRRGEYYAFAFDRVDDDLLDDAAFMQTLYSRAVRVSMGARGGRAGVAAGDAAAGAVMEACQAGPAPDSIGATISTWLHRRIRYAHILSTRLGRRGACSRRRQG